MEKLQHTFKSGLETSLHSLSMSTDQEHFISADEMSLNLWNLSEFKNVYNLINFNRPKGAPQPSELISSAQFN